MSTGGPGGFGQGGETNAYPGRGYPQYGTRQNAEVSNFKGGARGPAALPSRTTVPNGPAPAQPLRGPFGTISYHRGLFVEDAGAPRLAFDGVLGHGHIPWFRPVYQNSQGRDTYVPPTFFSRGAANSIEYTAMPDNVRVQRKQIGSFTVREEYGSTSQFYNNGSLAKFVASIQVGMNQQGRRWLAQAKTGNPRLVNLSRYGTAGSYGQTTTTLPTRPANVPATYSEYGAY